ncbi:dUTP diphosphatase [Heyndrickxia coagulans]|uniref:dUTP diphosphatase n=1 Tax=Heyndrickxia coagulans TaxID=1398 RepID=UPI0006287BB4|nr:dUTP diphosphatase [Heyndrickxia coagulans]
MNLQKLFEAQADLDKHIIEKKGLHGINLLQDLILALQVELGECAQKWQGFKFWSNNREPILKGYKEIKCKWCNGSGDDGTGICPDCMSTGDVYKEYNPLLEEYVDCLHFTLSIGLHLYNENIATDLGGFRKTSIQDQFRTLFHYSTMLSGSYWNFFEYLIGLGEMLGFTWEQIEQAYFEKNEENHKRQENGY